MNIEYTIYYIEYFIYVTGMEMGLRKRWRGSDAFIVFGILAWMLADVQTNDHVSDAHA